MARTKTHPVLAALRSLVKAHDRINVHGFADPKRESYSDAFIFTLSGTKNVEGVEVKSSIEVKGIVRNGNTSEQITREYEGRSYLAYSEAFRPIQGYASLWDEAVLRSAVNSIPVDCEPMLEVYLDSGTNQLCVDAKIHVDTIYLIGKNPQGEIERRFIVSSGASKHNSARFGAPNSETDSVGRGS